MICCEENLQEYDHLLRPRTPTVQTIELGDEGVNPVDSLSDSRGSWKVTPDHSLEAQMSQPRATQGMPSVLPALSFAKSSANARRHPSPTRKLVSAIKSMGRAWLM